MAGVLALAVCGAAALYWASRSETALRWAIAQLSPYLPGKLEVEGVRGALVQPIAIARVSYLHDGAHVDLRDVELDWSPRALFVQRRLLVQSLRAGSVEIAPGRGGGKRPLPATIALPLPVELQRIDIAQLRVLGESGSTIVGPIQGSYRADAEAHVLRIDRIASSLLDGAATLTLGTQTPFALTGGFDVRFAASPQWPVSAKGEVRGDLGALGIQADLAVRGMAIPVHAQLQPLDAQPLRDFTARARDVDLAQLVEKAPRTRLDVTVHGAGAADVLARGTLSLANGAAGPLDRNVLPLHQATSNFSFDGRTLQLDNLHLSLGAAGTAQGRAALRADLLETQLTLSAIDLRHLHAKLRTTRLNGALTLKQDAKDRRIGLTLSERGIQARIDARQRGDVLTIDTMRAQLGGSTVQASGRLDLSGARAFEVDARTSRLNPADFGDFPVARLSGRVQASGHLSPSPRAALRYELSEGRWRGQPVAGSGHLNVAAERVEAVDATLQVGRNRLVARGALGQPADVLQFELDLPALSVLDADWRGKLRATGTVGGRFAQPHLQAQLAAQDLALGTTAVQRLDATAAIERSSDPRLSLEARASGLRLGSMQADSASLDVRGLRSQHDIRLDVKGDSVDLLARLNGAATPALDGWSGSVVELIQRKLEPFALRAPAPLALTSQRVTFGPATMDVSGGRVELGQTVYGGGRLQSNGTATRFPATKLLKLAGAPAAWSTDLLLGARWQLSAADAVDGRVEIFREAGDLAVQVEDKRIALGLARLSGIIDVARSSVDASFEAQSPTLGSARVEAHTRLAMRNGRWGLPGSAPLRMNGHATIASVRPIAALLTSSVRVDGNIAVRLSANGTVAAPGLRGTVDGKGLSIEQVGSGVFLRDGIVRAEFVDTGLALKEFSIRAGDGVFHASGDYAIADQALRLQWRADQLAAVQMPDLLLVASGAGTLHADRSRLELTGAVRADKGRAELREVSSATLGEDVVIVGETPRQGVPSRLAQGRLDLRVDLGDDFKVFGRGLDARIDGKLHVHNNGGALQADGRIEVRSGTYEAYGRKLDIERGVLLFTGSLSNPALDIRAMRKNMQVEAGVEVTGTVRRPEARLVSVPEVPDMEKLSWITLGRRNDTASQSDTQALQRYAAALAATLGTGSIQSKAAEALGLDEISISPGMDGNSASGVIQVGKRLGDRIYVLIEQRLSTAGNVVKVNYQFARDWSLRLESGETDAVDLFYTFSFD